MPFLPEIITGGACLAVGVVFSWAYLRARARRRSREETAAADSVLERARRQSEEILRESRLQAAEEGLRTRQEIEASFTMRRTEEQEREKRLNQREILLNAQLERLSTEDRELARREDSLQQRAAALVREEERIAQVNLTRQRQLEDLAGMSRQQAREVFLREIQMESTRDAANIHRAAIEEARQKAEEKAREIIGQAIQRYASHHTNDVTTTNISLTDVEIKGRIIGREGRNIRAFENATGVTVLIDDTPNTVVLSSFDPVRREVAREAMLQLIQDGRIHPNRIEEVVAHVSQEMEQTIARLGAEAVAQVGVAPMHPEVVKLLGRLHFRRSFSQNILRHSVEVAQLTGLMAAELGVDLEDARRAGLLHDIGKAMDQETPGPHATVGAEMLRRHGENAAVVNGVASHHFEVQPEGVIGILVNAADAISASRPGARSENMGTYLKRVEDLEKIGLSFPGVEKCYSVHAGRELRVFVKPTDLNDDESFDLARKIAQRVESELQYPGQIRVTVIRETRCVEVAK
ncbi:MAG: ribonuclease Y [Verrucomicrobia bacterium]|jgi:ribonuclease Y|nr:ribonuclease Y [Verrucomicrobiota bacterium]